MSSILGYSLSVSSSYKVPSRHSDTSASVPWLWLLWGLLFGSFCVKD